VRRVKKEILSKNELKELQDDNKLRSKIQRKGFYKLSEAREGIGTR
jgi:hypothetical protein